MRKLATILLIALSSTVYAGSTYSSSEIGFLFGDSYYIGDLNKQHFLPYNPMGGIFFRYNFDSRLSLRTGYTYGQIEGSDAGSSSSFNAFRNFAFQSTLHELSLLGEMSFFPFNVFDSKSYLISPYCFMGVAYLNHNPRAFFKGDYIKASTLQTEGQDYSRHIMTVPMGLGVKFLTGRVSLGFEWGIRKTWSDYLDDVSTTFLEQASLTTTPQQVVGNSTSLDDAGNKQRGDVYSKDWYVFTGISLFVNLRPKEICRSFN